MFTRFRNGWSLGMASVGLLRQNPKLLVFPFFSTIACAVVLASFVLPLVGTPTGQAILASEDPNAGIGHMLVLFLMYFCCYLVMLFFNSALVGVTMLYLDGRDYKLTDGLRIAWDRFSLIILWALIAASVGFALKMIEQRSKLVGKIIALLLGSAWTAITYFVVPVLIVERAPAHQAIGRSFSLMRQTWGEGLVANWATDLVVVLGTLLCVPVMLLGFATGDPIVIGITILLCLAWFGFMMLVSMTLETVLTAVLYVYARTGEAPEGFDAEMLGLAFAGRGGSEAIRIGNEGPETAEAQSAISAGGGLPAMPAMPAAQAGPSLADIRARQDADAGASTDAA
ncbi:MAG: DUF6159 family protein [Planctomycetota bacterium]